MRSFDLLLDLLSTIPDPRRAEGKVYTLRHVLLFSILAVVTGGNSFRSIETFIKVHRRRLNSAFGLRWKRAPCHTGIRYILQGLDPAAVEQAFREHATGLLNSTTDPSRRAIALDGKTLRGSFDNFHDRKAARVLPCVRHRSRAGLGAYRYRGEIQRDPSRAKITRRTRYRALHRHARCPALPKKTFEAAVEAQVQAVIQLKDNQPTLLLNVKAACASQRSTGSDISVCASRNRHETRQVDVFPAVAAVADTEWKPLIKCIVRVTRRVLHRSAKTGLWNETGEVAFYLANCSLAAKRAGTAVRCHWHVENTLHYTRDVTFQEDRSRIRHNPGVFARLRSFAYNILRRNKTSTFSQDRYAAALQGLDPLLKWCVS